MRGLLGAVALAVLLAACSDTASTPRTSPHTTTSAVAFDDTSTEVSTVIGPDQVHLASVRVGSHEGFDRVVFEFDVGLPGYAVKYVERPITADGSGAEVHVGGKAVLSVRMEHATAAPDGSARVAGAGNIVEVVPTGDFEAVLNFAVGLNEKAQFRAYTSEGKKLIIDIAHA